MDKAAIISGIQSDEIRAQTIAFCSQGATLKQLKEMATIKKEVKRSVEKKRGRIAQKVNLGATKNIAVAKTIMAQVVKLPELKHHAEKFKIKNWSEYSEVTKAFYELIRILEENIGKR